MPSRTFVVTVAEAPHRVVVEDVRTGERTLAEGLTEVAPAIAAWLEPAAQRPQEEAEE